MLKSTAIIEAIESGLREYQKQVDARKLEEEKAAIVKREWRVRCEEYAKVWVDRTLPILIKEETAKGKRSLIIGSSDYGNSDYDVVCKAEEARRLGLKIREESYKADPGSDGAYAHGDGCSYYIEW